MTSTKSTRRILCLVATLVFALCAFAGCGDNIPAAHVHTFDETKWVNTDPTNHWHPATCEHTSEKGSVAKHAYDEGSDTCKVCGYKKATDPGKEPEEFKPTYNTEFKPTLFSVDNLKYEVTELGDGVNMVATAIKLNAATEYNKETYENRPCVVYTIEVDLNKAGIAAGTKGNTHESTPILCAAPYSHAKDWEAANEGGHVYTSLNADFFGRNSTTGLADNVNAFVKDGVIMKAGHNDNGNYDYKNAASDVPASAPMLFGVKGNKAQIAPIIKYTGDPMTASVKQPIIKAKLSYENHYSIEGVATEYNSIVENVVPTDTAVAFLYSGTAPQSVRAGALVLKVDLTGGTQKMKVLEKTVLEGRESLTPSAGNYGYLIALSGNEEGFEYFSKATVNGYVLATKMVKSPDGTWDGYETILGCRQALIIDGEIPETVAKENTNSAQATGIPRSAVGIKDGKVVIFAVESLYYYKRANPDGSDPHGMNLPELAEFMKYYGIEQGANFDGGGSTHLVVKDDKGGDAKTMVRSADYGYDKTGTTQTRIVINSILVTNKPSK